MSQTPETSRIWMQSGPRDAVSITVDKDSYVLGFRLWGVASGTATYSITIQIKQASQILSTWTGTYRSTSSEKTYPVRFSEPVKLVSSKTYSLIASIRGQNVYRGQSGTSLHTCNGTNIKFDVSHDDQNYSNVQRGQIPAVIFGFV